MFLQDNLEILDVLLESAWFGADSKSTLFIRFRSADQLRVLHAKHRLFSLPNRIVLGEDLT
jgi:hypothetical protein